MWLIASTTCLGNGCPERKGGDSQCVHRIDYYLMSDHCALSRFVVDQAGKIAFRLFADEQEVTCETLYLLLKNYKGRVRNALAVDSQIFAEVETLLTPPDW